jgi:hypothetical protein
VTNPLAAPAKIGSVKAASRWNLLREPKLHQTEMKGVGVA